MKPLREIPLHMHTKRNKLTMKNAGIEYILDVVKADFKQNIDKQKTT